MPRTAKISRKTKETDISLELNLDGTGQSTISTGVGFFDHMLTHLSKHSLMDLTVNASGDTHIDDHHTVEDVSLVLGTALEQALGNKAGIFKALAKALRQAIAEDARASGAVPSTKGTL